VSSPGGRVRISVTPFTPVVLITPLTGAMVAAHIVHAYLTMRVAPTACRENEAGWWMVQTLSAVVAYARR
jgi:hypothetical protein